MATTSDPGTGIYLVTVTTAEGRTVEEAGDQAYVDEWLVDALDKPDELPPGSPPRPGRHRA